MEFVLYTAFVVDFCAVWFFFIHQKVELEPILRYNYGIFYITQATEWYCWEWTKPVGILATFSFLFQNYFLWGKNILFFDLVIVYLKIAGELNSLKCCNKSNLKNEVSNIFICWHGGRMHTKARIPLLPKFILFMSDRQKYDEKLSQAK